MSLEWADKDNMLWLVSAVVLGVLLLCGIGWAWNRRRHWSAELERLIQSPPGAGPVDPNASAEAHFLRGCAMLESRQPAAAVRHFQLAHHGNHAYELAAILTFTCMKLSPDDMPQLLRTLVQTIQETSRGRIPSGPREKEFLARIATLSEPMPGGLSSHGTLFWRLPIAPLRQQLLDAREGGFEWAVGLYTASKPTPTVATAPA